MLYEIDSSLQKESELTRKSFKGLNPGARLYHKTYFGRVLSISKISYSVCPWQAVFVGGQESTQVKPLSGTPL
jgi:hypothetical protein